MGPGPLGDLHGEIRSPPGGLVQPHPPVAVVLGRDGQICRQVGQAWHVRPDEALPCRPVAPRPRHHRLPGAIREQLQTLYRGHVRTDQGGVERRQSHRRFPRLRHGDQGRAGGMPDPGQRREPLPRLCRAAGRRAGRDRAEDGAGTRTER